MEEQYNFEVLHKLVNNLDVAECRGRLAQLIKSKWIDEHWETANARDLESLVIVAESGIEHSKMQKTTAKIVKSGKLSEDFVHAFRRFNTKKPNLEAVRNVFPESPQSFATPFTMWQWHHDFMKSNEFDDVFIWLWESHLKQALRLYKLWSPPPLQDKPSLALKRAQRIRKWLVIVPDLKASEYLTTYEGELMTPEGAAAARREALQNGKLKLFGQNAKLDKLSRMLDREESEQPSAEKLESFMFEYGADAVVASPQTAARQASLENTKSFEVVAFPTSAFKDPFARSYILLVLAVMRFKKTAIYTMEASSALIFQSVSLPNTPLTIIRRRHVAN